MKSRPRTTKTLAWREADEAVLRRLRAQVAARFGVVVTERDLVSAALRLALRDPSGLRVTRPGSMNLGTCAQPRVSPDPAKHRGIGALRPRLRGRSDMT